MNISPKHIVACTVLLLVASGAFGQIVPVQDGRALDSSTLVGSGRINSRTPERTSFSSQMYITGQVSGLGAFKGVTGYSAANELRMTVPSSVHSGFRRQSVGLSDVLSGPTYRAGAYMDRSRTAMGLRGITAGLTSPGTNMPKAGNVGSIMDRKAIDDAMSDFRPLLGKRPGNAISVNAQPAIKLEPTGPRVVKPRGLGTAIVAAPGFGASELAVFTVSRPSQRGEVDVELRELERLENDDARRIDSKRRGGSVLPPVAGGDDGKGRTALGNKGLADQAALDSDVFLAMVYLLQKQHLESSGGSTPAADPSGDGDKGDGDDPKMKLKPLGARPDSVKLVEQGLRGELVFKTLAGKAHDTYNMAMRAGEKQLAEAKFYNAADQYRLAVEVAPENPTARLGLAAALFGAGESLGAALQLRRAMELFPPVMVTRLQVIRKIPSKKLKARLDQIYKRLEGRRGANVDPQLAMLATYMHRGAGENYIAELCAVKLRDAAAEDKLYAAYATYVLTGKRPGALKAPTTRPAAEK